jgi:hypothetical protein
MGSAEPAALEASMLWKAQDGTIPPLDDPTLQLSAQQWERPPLINFNLILKRVASGMIGEPDMALTNILLDWRCVTERQIRRLTSHAFAKEHQAGTRLRTLQKMDWFDGLWYQQSSKEREHIWFLGSAAFHYYSIVHSMKLLDPLRMLQFKDYMLSLCAINELPDS